MSNHGDATWTIQSILNWTRDHFGRRGIDSPRLDAELLLSHVLDCERITLYTDYDRPLDGDERARLRGLVQRRARHEPIAYILGGREFFGRQFATTPEVLIPRPETEHLIEYAVPWLESQGREGFTTAEGESGAQSGGDLRAVDVGIGSGCIAITLLCEIPQLQMWGTDIAPGALAVAQDNARRHGVDERLTLVEGDLLQPVTPGRYDLVVSNPPYIEDQPALRRQLQADVVDFEPHHALFAGPDGLLFVRRLVQEVPPYLRPGGLFLCEFGHTHGQEVFALLDSMAQWGKPQPIMDLQGYTRAVAVERL